jgi:hypothetical protein
MLQQQSMPNHAELALVRPLWEAVAHHRVILMRNKSRIIADGHRKAYYGQHPFRPGPGSAGILSPLGQRGILEAAHRLVAISSRGSAAHEADCASRGPLLSSRGVKPVTMRPLTTR